MPPTRTCGARKPPGARLIDANTAPDRRITMVMGLEAAPLAVMAGTVPCLMLRVVVRGSLVHIRAWSQAEAVCHGDAHGGRSCARRQIDDGCYLSQSGPGWHSVAGQGLRAAARFSRRPLVSLQWCRPCPLLVNEVVPDVPWSQDG